MKKAFTLIELLVVIAIIAILAAILFPVFAQAKMAAKKTTDVSNIKQTATAVVLYLNDSDDVYPMGAGACWYAPTDGGWTYDTQRYIKSVAILRSPSDPLSKATWPSWMVNDPTYGVGISYVSNGLIACDNTGCGIFGVMGVPQPSAWKGTTRCDGSLWMTNHVITTASNVTKPSETVAFASRYGSATTWGPSLVLTGWKDWESCCNFPGKLPDGGDGTKFNYGGGTTNTGWPKNTGGPYTFKANGKTFTINENDHFGALSSPYAKKTVVTFTDTHAAALDPIRTNPDGNLKPEENMWNAYR